MTTNEPPPDPRSDSSPDKFEEYSDYLASLSRDPAMQITGIVVAAVLAAALLAGAILATAGTATSVIRTIGFESHHLDNRDDRQFFKRGPGRGGSERTTPPESSGPESRFGGLGAWGELLGTLTRGVQHGDVVVQQPGGQPETKRFVKGTVSAKRGNVMVITATDKYAGRFTVTATTRIDGATGTSGLADLATGSEAFAVGTVAGKTVRAELITTRMLGLQ